ncbi:STAS domain-containing protein [Yinghuangia sp. ASG 101]|uniref:STAS domain-containing protein n=1 Tax=Yinghuangia sp. ASG 101 TaxID=2896848 RepID=UPI001E318C89|nr:STAS domain-containing protein [Yinghuangia sp. ASG 101]UGQ10314.1 STAS domain-containing protein [Yinghuangia sp. ASG 101]
MTIARGDGWERGVTETPESPELRDAPDPDASAVGGFPADRPRGRHPGEGPRPGTWTVVPVTGDLDFASAPALAEAFRVLTGDAAGPQRVVVDLHEVEYMDSTGLRILLGMARDLRENGGALRLAGPGDLVVRLLDVTQVTSLLPTYADVTAACRD